MRGVHARGVRARAVVVGALLALAACYQSLDEFSGGKRDTPDGAQDAANDADDGTGDGAPGTVGDGGGGPADAARFCESQDAHTVCDDFDGYRDAGWSLVEQYSGGGLRTTGESFTSGPSSLVASIPSTSGETGATLIRRLDPATTRVHVEADVKVCALDRGFASFLYFESHAGTLDEVVATGIQRNYDTTPARLETYLAAFRSDDFEEYGYAGAVLPSERFVHLVLDVTFHPTTGSMRLVVDGAERFARTNIATSSAAMATRRDLYAGIFSDNGPACAIQLDNLVVDAFR